MALYTTPVFNINLKKTRRQLPASGKIVRSGNSRRRSQRRRLRPGRRRSCRCVIRRRLPPLFVAHGSEGEKIRPLVPDAEIYVLQGIGADSLPYFRTARLTPVICSPQMYAFWQQNRIDGIRPLIQVETGLNRLGFTVAELERLAETERKDFAGVLSHLSCADEQAHFMNARQLAAFRAIKARFFPATPATLSASDGVFLGDDFHFDMTRLGAAMYGINTAPYRENQMQNILELKAPVLQVKPLPKGEFVGYSATFRAPCDMRIAIVSVGYGDGLPRSLSSRGKVIFYADGKPCFCPILGRVSMDNIICDISALAPEAVSPGDFGWLINDDYTVDDIARDAGTIAYELISNLGKNPRFVKNYIR